MTEHNHEPKITIDIGNKESIVLKTSGILCCKAYADYTKFYLTDARIIIGCRNLKYYTEQLKSHDFSRIHSNCLVNMAHIDRYKHRCGRSMVVLTNETLLEVSRRKWKSFLAEYNRFMKGK